MGALAQLMDPGRRADSHPGAVAFLPAVPLNTPDRARYRQCGGWSWTAGDSRFVTSFSAAWVRLTATARFSRPHVDVRLTIWAILRSDVDRRGRRIGSAVPKRRPNLGNVMESTRRKNISKKLLNLSIWR